LDIAKLTAHTRDNIGKGAARSLRREGKIPGILYGSGIDNIKLSLESRELEKMFSSPEYSRGLINLEIKGGDPYSKTVMVKELQIDPVKAHFLHLDLLEIRMDKKIATMVSINPVGTPKGVEEGGTLQIIRRELEVYCLPANIPEHIDVDVSKMEMGDSLKVSDIEVSGDVEIPYDVDFTVATVVSPRMEEAPEEGEEGETAGEGEEAGASEGEND
jgi:large subunit ribosomal protein L25